jgi:glutathione S-transferase
MIRLFIQKNCPFCQKVLRAVREMNLDDGVDFELVEASPGTPGRDEVARVGGKSMVPFLIDGDFFMYESDHIIGYLARKFGTPVPGKGLSMFTP